MSGSARRLVLVGGGHAHLEVLRSFVQRRAEGEVILISTHPSQLYSGRMPAQLRGVMPERALCFDLAALCDAAGVQFVPATATRVEASTSEGLVTLAGDTSPQSIAGDLISLDIGAVTAGVTDTPGVATHASVVRPHAAWQSLVQRLHSALQLAGSRKEAFSATVVGSGASGVELALAVHAKAVRSPGLSRDAVRVQVIESGPRILGGWNQTVSARVHDLLESRGIVVRTATTVSRVEADAVILDQGERVPSRLAIWSTGAAAPPLLADSPLPRDAKGFLLVQDTLRAVDDRAVWGAGDCITLDGAPWMPKSGVYAVRAAPVLAHNLREVLRGAQAWQRYTPQRTALALLDTADGRALAYRGTWSVHHASMLWLKTLIDGRFMRRYQQLYR